MTEWTNIDLARSALADPRLPPFELAAIAAAQPSLWPQVAAHPAAYPELLAWLASRGVPVPPPLQPDPNRPAPPQAMPQQFASQQPPGQPMPGPQPQQSQFPPGAVPPTQSGAPTPKKRRTGLVVGIVLAAVVLIAAGGAVLWTMLAQPSPTTPSPRVSSSPTPSYSRSASASPSTRATASSSRTAVVPDATPVPIAPGEKVFLAKPEMTGADKVAVGFILSADGKTARAMTVSVSGGESREKCGCSRIVMTTTKTTPVNERGVVMTMADGGVKLAVTIVGDTATGAFQYRAEVSGHGTQPKATLDLGTALVVMEAS